MNIVNVNMNKLFIYAATVCTILVSCSTSEHYESNQPSEPLTKIPIKLSIGNFSRANDNAFEVNDKVGVYVVNYNGSTAGTLAASGNYVTNMQFTYQNSEWIPESAIYWKDNTTHADFYAYYPYSASANTSAHPFSVKANQSTEDDYWASDFLWGKATNIAPTEETVPITTNHVFSNVLIYLEAGYGFTTETLSAATKSVKINNLKTSATINLATGVATATGSATQVTPWSVGGYYRAMVVPQTVADGTSLITVTIDGVDYTLKSGATFVANKQHEITVTVNKSSNGVNIGIGGWGDGSDFSGDAE